VFSSPISLKVSSPSLPARAKVEFLFSSTEVGVGFFVGVAVAAFGVGVLVGVGILVGVAEGSGVGVLVAVGAELGVGVGVGRFISIEIGSLSELDAQEEVYLLAFIVRLPLLIELSPILVTSAIEAVDRSETL
jgi:hypothetical protein